MSISSSRTLTTSRPSAETRYSSSLSTTCSGVSAVSVASASPKSAPKHRHSQRGVIDGAPTRAMLRPGRWPGHTLNG